MNKGNIYLAIIILIIATVSIVLYVKYELPRRAGLDGTFSNLSISAEHGGEFVVTTLMIRNGDTKEIKTRKGYEFLKVKKGIYEIFNKDTEQGFYRKIVEYNISKNTTRIDFELDRPEEITVRSRDDGESINIVISSENYQNVRICLRHSLSYIFVNINISKIDLLDGYENWDKCYSLEKSIKGEEEVNLSYEISRIPEDDDFIEIVVIDTDYINGEYRNRFNEKDLGGEDVVVRIK